MSNCSTTPATPHSSFFRRPTYRAPSPPTWACYEQIPYDDYSDSGSEDDSCSEDDEEYPSRADSSDTDAADAKDAKTAGDNGDDIHNMDIDEVGDGNVPTADGTAPGLKKDVKGKQRAIEPDAEPELPKKPRERRKRRQPVYNLRPILTIHKSQGFVWNQVSPVSDDVPLHNGMLN